MICIGLPSKSPLEVHSTCIETAVVLLTQQMENAPFLIVWPHYMQHHTLTLLVVWGGPLGELAGSTDSRAAGSSCSCDC